MSVCKPPANKPAQADFKTGWKKEWNATEDSATAAVTASEMIVCNITPCGLNTVPNAPKMPTNVKVTIKNLTCLERRMEFRGPNVASKRVEFMATNNVAPS